MNPAIKTLLFGIVVYPMMCSAQTSGCDAKRQSIEQEIAYARAHGNARRIEGLETALAHMNANCSDAVLRSDAQRKVDAAQRKLSERLHDLQEAKASGKSAKKIADRQRKVDEAHAELEKAQVDASR
jgi:hypothetical protein